MANDLLCKSTSGILLLWHGFLLLSASRTQQTVAQSSCESEILAANAGAVEGIYLCNVLEELGINVKLRLRTDSSSGMATLCRRGPGRMRHLRVKTLWWQEEIRAGNVMLEKINTKNNLADILTKHLSPSEFTRQACQLGLEENA